jgi:hypothetical protein
MDRRRGTKQLIMKKTLVILILAALLNSCYRDVEEVLYPSTGNCDTTGVTYANTVAPLLQNNGCMSCHAGPSPSGGVSLDNHAGVRAVAQNGKLYGAINHSAGFSPMPQGGSKMNVCNISKIKAWIDAGAVNN